MRQIQWWWWWWWFHLGWNLLLDSEWKCQSRMNTSKYSWMIKFYAPRNIKYANNQTTMTSNSAITITLKTQCCSFVMVATMRRFSGVNIILWDTWHIYLAWTCSFTCCTEYDLIPQRGSSRAFRARWATWRACQRVVIADPPIHLESVSCGFEELVNTHWVYLLIAPPIAPSSATQSALWLLEKWDIGVSLMIQTQTSLRTS